MVELLLLVFLVVVPADGITVVTLRSYHPDRFGRGIIRRRLPLWMIVPLDAILTVGIFVFWAIWAFVGIRAFGVSADVLLLATFLADLDDLIFGDDDDRWKRRRAGANDAIRRLLARLAQAPARGPVPA